YFGNISNKKNLQMLQTNLYSPILMLQNLLKNLNKNAKIIFIGSIASKKFFNFGAVYQASKFGLRGFAGSIKNEFKDKKIYIINPTIVKTNFFGGQESKFNYKQTKIIDIFKTVENILNGKENRFEIDL
ncbi:SDR family oxidoreductase, partial [Candidatus Gracilibacteria bacterium]|nr:SDR family oxidoreductase [Candidatus Gracilibacteria bacterium]